MSETSINLRPEPSEHSAKSRKRILLVEGDGFTRLVLLLRLRLAGFGVDFTSNGTLGLGKLRSCHPDVLLVELKLCGISGLELIKAARAEPSFGDRPIYVFTHVDRLNRATRKEAGLVATKVFDKSTVTREELVQTFATMFLSQEAAEEQRPANTKAEPPAKSLGEAVPSEAIQQIVAGVREQSEVLVSGGADRSISGEELLSRVCSLTSCAEAAGLPNLARQAKALENFLNHLCRNKEGYTETALATVTRGVEVMNGMSFEPGKDQTLTQFNAVALDETPSSNRALEQGLLKAGFEVHCFEDPARARAYLASNRTELIIANVRLPEAHSLALADIRQLPLHSETPVLFGPDAAVTTPHGERLPTSAPRLDSEPLLLAELVVKALNELQSTNTLSELQSTNREAPGGRVSEPPEPARANVAVPSFEDGFELFARAGNVSSQPILRVEPGAMDADRAAEFIARLPATSPLDESQIDERPMEVLPPSGIEVEPTEPPQPEATVEDHRAAAAWLAAAAIETSQRVEANDTAPELEQNQAAALEQPATTTPNYDEVMNNQFQEASAYAAPAEVSQPAEVPGEGQNAGEDLAGRVCAAEMALYHAQKEIEQKDKAIEALQEHLAEATADQGQEGNRLAADAPAEQSLDKTQARCAELEQELATLRQAFEDFNGSFSQQQQAAAEAGKYVQELEQRLSQTAAEQEKQKEEQQRAAAELERQVKAATAAQRENETARLQAEARCGQLEQELGGLRKAQEEQANKLAQQQKVNAESGAPGSELEQQVRQGVAALARATAELARERGERQRSEQRTAELNGRLQALHEDLRRTLSAQREDLARISALEEQQRQTSQALDRRTADVEQLQAERRLAEEQLQKAKEVNAQLREDLSFFDAANKKFGGARQELHSQLEASLKAAREHEALLEQKSAEHQGLAERLEGLEQELQNQTRKRETLEQQLKTSQDALQEREAKLQKETAEKQRLKEALDSLQRNVRGGSERDLEFSKLQSDLQLEQVERKRQQTQLERMRQSALESAHAARALRTSLRRQVREPVDNLVQSARSLLELEMGEAQKKLAESVLQDVMLVQTRLREPELAHADSTDKPATPGITSK